MKLGKFNRALGWGLSLAVVFSLGLAALPIGAQAQGEMEWATVSTPSEEDFVILPDSDILDYAVGGDDGSIVYAVVSVGSGSLDEMLLKSDDGGVTWTDITDEVQDAGNLPTDFTKLTHVAVAPDDEDWLAVAGYASEPMVVASQDGGGGFSYAGNIEDTVTSTAMALVFDLAISPEVDDIHNIAVAGINGASDGTIFRLKAGTWLSGTWEDTSFYDGWASGAWSFAGDGVVAACEFSPNFDIDDTIVCMGMADGLPDFSPVDAPVLQSGLWRSGGAWNEEAEFPEAIQIKDGSDTLETGIALRGMGLALPADYDGSDPGARNIYLYVNASHTTKGWGGYVFMVEDDAISKRCGPSGNPLLASIAVYGEADSCKAMVGVYFGLDQNDTLVPFEECCDGVAVYHTVELDYCCPDWDEACKDPSGPYTAVVSYTPDGEKAYATTSGENDFSLRAGLCDESAFSVSLDDGNSWNQLGLIDTDIDYISDVAVCPDCETAYISTINNAEGEDCQVCECDSIWRTWTKDGDIGDVWERVYHGNWSNDPDNALLLRLPVDDLEDCCTLYMGIQDTTYLHYTRDCGQCWNKATTQNILIEDIAVETENIVYVLDSGGNVSKSTQYGRRPSDEVDTDAGSGHTIFVMPDDMVIVGGSDGDSVAWSDDGGETWTVMDDIGEDGDIHVIFDHICDDIVYAAVSDGSIYRGYMSDGSWEGLNALAYGYSGIALGRSDGTLYAPYVVSDGVVVTETTATASGSVDLTNVSITLRGLIGNPEITSTGNFINGEVLNVTGSNLTTVKTYPMVEVTGTIDVLGTYSGASGTINVTITLERDMDWGAGDIHVSDSNLIATVTVTSTTTYAYGTGVARNLTPCETDCCGEEDWDYLTAGLTGDEAFNTEPSALRICGCTTIATNSVLWAIDADDYKVSDASDGTLWWYEDCASKIGPTLLSPADDAVLDCDPCLSCEGIPFTLKWERMCIGCSWDIEIMDEDGNLITWKDMDLEDVPITTDPPEYYIDTSAIQCGRTYTWHVRLANTETGECVHSPWSDTWSFTIAASAADAVSLIAPDNGDMGIQISKVPFSWSSVSNADSYSFVLSPNSDLSGALASEELSGTAYEYTGTLDYLTPYYWQVTAWKDGTSLSQSAIGAFTTVAKAVPPPEPPAPAPAPVVNIPPTQMITPSWIYTIIGIGAALLVVVIVLIVRTRRP